MPINACMLKTRIKARLTNVVTDQRSPILDEQLVALIGATDGAERDFNEWRSAAQQAGLNPSKIQNLKRRGLIWTRITEAGVHMIVRGTRPVSVPE